MYTILILEDYHKTCDTIKYTVVQFFGSRDDARTMPVVCNNCGLGTC